MGDGMGLKLELPISVARTILNDLSSTTYPAADLLQYANDSLDAIVGIAPRYFYEVGTVECVADKVLQTVSFTDALALVSIDQVVGGSTPLQTDRDTLSAFVPGWMSEASAPAIHWMPLADSKTRFYVYPPAPSGQVLAITYVRIPCEYTATEDTSLPMTLSQAITDYIVYLALTRHDEYVDEVRAKAFMATFLTRLQ